MARASSALVAPTDERIGRVPDAEDIADCYRACDDQHPSPWFFSSCDTAEEPGRFDLPAPNGTSYWADDPVAALIEKLSDPDELEPLVTVTTLRRLRVWTHHPPDDSRIADTTARASRIPKELGTTTPYTLPWRWAEAFHADGRHGLRWWLRFDPAATRGVALFGPAGTAPSHGPATDTTATVYAADLAEVFDGLEHAPRLDELPIAKMP